VICCENTALSSKDQEGKQEVGTWTSPYGGNAQPGCCSQHCSWRPSLV